MALNITKSQKNTPLLTHQGYSYNFDVDGVDKKIWRCVLRKSRNCLGRVHTDADITTVISESKNHNHTPNSADCEKRELLANLKSTGKASTESTGGIVATAIEGLPVAVLGKLPPLASMKRTVQRARQETIQGALKNVSSRSELILPESFTKLKTGEQFLKFDSGNNNQRILIFSTLDNLAQLSSSKHWYADGTFKTSPSLFEQFFVIHGSLGEHVLPLVYILTPNRTRSTYDRALEAFASAFPASRQRVCFFFISHNASGARFNNCQTSCTNIPLLQTSP